MRVTYEHVTYRYAPGAPLALNDVSVEFDTTHITGICGRAGSGKTTFIHHLNGILKPASGQISIDGENIHASSATLTQIRQRIGMVFQFPERQLFGRTVWEELSYSLERRQFPKAEIERRIQWAAERLHFDLHAYRNRSPFALSRGEQRKLGIAVMLSLQPELIVLDEPTAGMDRAAAYQFLGLLQELHHQEHLHIVLVSHNLELLCKYTDAIIILSKGKVGLAGTPLEIINNAAALETFGLSLPPLQHTLFLLHQQYPHVKTAVLSVSEAVAAIKNECPRRSGSGLV